MENYHECCKIFPLIEGAAFKELVADIKANGLQHPIVTYKGAILDGRNRDRACMAASVAPRYVEYEGSLTPEAYVFSVNITRRQLTTAQKAFCAAELATRTRGNQAHKSGLTTEQSAKMAGVATSSVVCAKAVLNAGHDPLTEAVKTDKVGLQTAADIVRENAARLKFRLSVSS